MGFWQPFDCFFMTHVTRHGGEVVEHVVVDRQKLRTTKREKVTLNPTLGCAQQRMMNQISAFGAESDEYNGRYSQWLRWIPEAQLPLPRLSETHPVGQPAFIHVGPCIMVPLLFVLTAAAVLSREILAIDSARLKHVEYSFTDTQKLFRHSTKSWVGNCRHIRPGWMMYVSQAVSCTWSQHTRIRSIVEHQLTQSRAGPHRKRSGRVFQIPCRFLWEDVVNCGSRFERRWLNYPVERGSTKSVGN